MMMQEPGPEVSFEAEVQQAPAEIPAQEAPAEGAATPVVSEEAGEAQVTPTAVDGGAVEGVAQDSAQAPERAEESSEINLLDADAIEEKRQQEMVNVMRLLPDDVLDAKSEDDVKAAIENDLRANGASDEEVEIEIKKTETLLERMAGMAGRTLGEYVKTSAQESSFSDFVAAFLVFGAEGHFGGSSLDELRGGLEADSSDAYLNEALQGDEAALTKFFSEVLGDSNIENVDELRKLIKEFNVMAEKSPESWSQMQLRMERFLNDAGKSGEHTFPQFKEVFRRLEHKNEDKVREFFGLKAETSSDAGAQTTDASAAPATEQQLNQQPNQTEQRAA